MRKSQFSKNRFSCQLQIRKLKSLIPTQTVNKELNKKLTQGNTLQPLENGEKQNYITQSIDKQKNLNAERRSSFNIVHRKTTVATHVNHKLKINSVQKNEKKQTATQSNLVENQVTNKKQKGAKEQRKFSIVPIVEIIMLQELKNSSEIVSDLIKDKIVNLSIDNKVVQASIDNFRSIIHSFVQKIKVRQENIQKIKGQKEQMTVLLKGFLPKDFQKVRNRDQTEIQIMRRKIKAYQNVVKMYRFGSEEQIAAFQTKIQNFRPSCQKELLEVISNQNKQNRILSYENLFLREKIKNMKFSNKDGKENNETIFEDMQKKIELNLHIQKAQQEINHLRIMIETRNKQIERLIEIEKKYQSQIKVNKIQKKQIQRQSDVVGRLEKQKKQQRDKIFQLSQEIYVLERSIQQEKYKLEQVSQLKQKINILDKLKDANISKILNLEGQIKKLEAKIQSITKNSVQFIKTIEQSLKNSIDRQNTIQKILQMFQLRLRSLSKGNQQTVIFLSHLVKKLKQSYEQKIKYVENKFKEIQDYNKMIKKYQQKLFQKHQGLQIIMQKCSNQSKQLMNSLNEITLKLRCKIDDKNSIQVYLYQIEQIINQLKIKADNLPLMLRTI